MTVPEWVLATIRYTVTTLGVFLVAYDVVPETSWDQIAPALVSLLTALYGVYRTRKIEQDNTTLAAYASKALAAERRGVQL